MRNLLEKRAKIADQARSIILKAQGEGRALTSDEQVSYDAHMVDVEGLNQTIQRARQSEALHVELDGTNGPARPAGEEIVSRGSDRNVAAVNAWLRGGYGSVVQNDEFRSLLPRGGEGQGDSVLLRAASPLGTNSSAAGAATVPQDFYNQLTDAMKWYGGVREAGPTVLRTASGASLPMPTVNDTSNVGELLAEHGAATQASTEMAFSSVTLGAYKFSSKIVKVSIELLQDSAFDISAFVAKKLGQRIGRITNQYFTTGTGSSQPSGIITGASAGVTAAGAAALTYADLKGLEHSIDYSYRANAKFMFKDSTASKIEQILDGNSRPILYSSLNGIQGTLKAGDATKPGQYFLLGYPVVINEDMAAATTGLKSVLFGDMSAYHLREVLDITLVRLNELYMPNAQVGFVAFYRADGAVLDAGTNPLKYITQA